jgi:UDP-glucuronate 4-epimerase
MRVLITGGAGFIGSTLADALLARGDSVTVLDNFDPYYDPKLKWANLEAAQGSSAFALVEGDIRDRESAAQLFARGSFDAVVHLAAQAGVRQSLADPYYYVDVNINGTLSVLDAAVKHGKPRFILASTSSVYGATQRFPFNEQDPLVTTLSPYGVTKIACEKFGQQYHHIHGLPVVALRFFTVYGPRQRPDMAISKFARAILAGDPITLFGDGSSSRDYTYVDDIVAGIIAAVDSKARCEVLNLGNSYTTTLLQLVGMLEAACGKSADLQFEGMQPGDPKHTCADISRARELLGYEPTTLPQDGIPRFISWLTQAQSLSAGK